MHAQPTVLRGAVLTFEASGDHRYVAHFTADGAVAWGADGLITEVAPWARFIQEQPRWAECYVYRGAPGRVIMPGLIDAHLHFPQMNILGAFGSQLLEWLDTHVFPAEARFAEKEYAAAMAARFWPWLASHGTTASCVYSSSHDVATEALCAAAASAGARAIIGTVLMDRNGPADLLQPTATALAAADQFLQRLKHHPRLEYALTPRFAPTCSVALLKGLGALLKKHPGTAVQTHLAENHGEIAWVKELFPTARDYTDVYDAAGLLTPRTLLGHGIWLTDGELARLAETRAVIVHCPVSNQFLGSGAANLHRLRKAGVRVALGSDIAGGNTLSMFQVMDAAAKTALSTGHGVAPLQWLGLATAGNADALGWGQRMGRLAPGYEANVVVVNPGAAPEHQALESLAATLVHRGDDRMVEATVVLGRWVFE